MGGDVSPQLQKVEVPVIGNRQCNWRSLYLGKITGITIDNDNIIGNLRKSTKIFLNKNQNSQLRIYLYLCRNV